MKFRSRIEKEEKKKTKNHDNYGFFDIFKKKEKLYSEKCGTPPVEDDYNSSDAYNEALEEYNQCVEDENKALKESVNEQGDKINNTVDTLGNFWARATGKAPVYDSSGNQVSVSSGSTQKGSGMQAVIWVVVILVVLIILYIAFFKKKKIK